MRGDGDIVFELITVVGVMLKDVCVTLGKGYMIVELSVTVTSNHERTEVVTAGMVTVVVSTLIAYKVMEEVTPDCMNDVVELYPTVISVVSSGKLKVVSVVKVSGGRT